MKTKKKTNKQKISKNSPRKQKMIHKILDFLFNDDGKMRHLFQYTDNG